MKSNLLILLMVGSLVVTFVIPSVFAQNEFDREIVTRNNERMNMELFGDSGIDLSRNNKLILNKFVYKPGEPVKVVASIPSYLTTAFISVDKYGESILTFEYNVIPITPTPIVNGTIIEKIQTNGLADGKYRLNLLHQGRGYLATINFKIDSNDDSKPIPDDVMLLEIKTPVKKTLQNNVPTIQPSDQKNIATSTVSNSFDTSQNTQNVFILSLVIAGGLFALGITIIIKYRKKSTSPKMYDTTILDTDRLNWKNNDDQLQDRKD